MPLPTNPLLQSQSSNFRVLFEMFLFILIFCFPQMGGHYRRSGEETFSSMAPEPQLYTMLGLGQGMQEVLTSVL